MIQKLEHNYLLDHKKRLLYKIETESNMLWSKGGYPALRKDVVYRNIKSFDWIGVKTEKRKFVINKSKLSQFQDIQFPGYEPQIFLDQDFFEGWEITELEPKPEQKMFGY